jgi:hypothetical protein
MPPLSQELPLTLPDRAAPCFFPGVVRSESHHRHRYPLLTLLRHPYLRARVSLCGEYCALLVSLAPWAIEPLLRLVGIGRAAPFRCDPPSTPKPLPRVPGCVRIILGYAQEQTASKTVPWSSFPSHVGDPAAARRRLRRARRRPSARNHRQLSDPARMAQIESNWGQPSCIQVNLSPAAVFLFKKPCNFPISQAGPPTC